MAKTSNQVIVSTRKGRLNRPVAAAKRLYEGCVSFIDSSGNATDVTNSGANTLGGLNVAEVDNSGGAAGDKDVELLRDVVQLEGSGFTDADVGKPAFVSDNFTVTLTAAGNVPAGPIVKVISSTQVMVDISDSPVVKQSAYTQTYATANKTHANPTATTLTDNTAGTATTTLEALADGTVYATDVAKIRNNFADLAASNNALIVDLADVKALVNSVIDDLQAQGLVG